MFMDSMGQEFGRAQQRWLVSVPWSMRPGITWKLACSHDWNMRMAIGWGIISLYVSLKWANLSFLLTCYLGSKGEGRDSHILRGKQEGWSPAEAINLLWPKLGRHTVLRMPHISMIYDMIWCDSRNNLT